MNTLLETNHPIRRNFITITCLKRLLLSTITVCYDAVYKWFLYLKRTFPVANIMDTMDIDLSKRI
jgi:hypothetical protein